MFEFKTLTAATLTVACTISAAVGQPVSLAPLSSLPGVAAAQSTQPQPSPSQPTQPTTQAAAAVTLNQEDLEELLGPIALYPDNLLASVMAACCYPDEIAKAAAYVQGGGDAAKLAEQGWEPPVQAVAKVPDALKILADSPEWTAAIGQAYMVQSKDVMAAIQSLRAKAKASGALASNQQQTIVEDGSTIIIESSQPEVVYVPTYQPSVVYAPPPPGYSSGDVAAAGMISFGFGLMIGAALDNDCDWYGGGICWGGGDVDIDVDREINIDEVNIDRDNVNRGDVNRGENRVGREGTAWQPNQQKIQAQGGARTDQLSQFRGASSGSQAAGARIPGQDRNAAAQRNVARQNPTARQPAARQTPAPRQTPAARQTPAPRSSPSAGRVPQPNVRQSPGSTAGRTPQRPPSGPSPAARSSPNRNPSAFSTDRPSAAAQNRGAASRSSAGVNRGGSRPSPSRGGGGRSGGGGRGGRR